MMGKMQPTVHRYSLVTRLAHWVWVVAFLVLVSSGLAIFNAAPYLDASDKSDPARRVLSIDAPREGVGTTSIFGRTFTTTGWLGWTDDGMGGRAARAFPGWITIPGPYSLADGRRWHLFFGWIAAICWVAWVISAALKGHLAQMLLHPRDLKKLWPMQAYYLKLRAEPPPHGRYNPLQKAAYTVIGFIVAPLVVVTGLALSPGVDAMFPFLTVIFGGRQFARLWHFVGMGVLIGFVFVHVFQVLTQGFANQMRSMITGWYRPSPHERNEA